MANKSVEQKHSETAIFAASIRAVTSEEFGSEKFGPDYLAKYFLPPHFRFFIRFKKIRADVKRKFNTFSPGMYEYIIARTAYFDAVFSDSLNKKIPQIVLLGAGYDSRGYRFSDLGKSTRIFELDVATTQQRKKKCLRKAGVDIPPNVTFVPINFNRESIKTVLEKAGFNPDKKSVFLWEGVAYYLHQQSVDTTLEFISHCSHPETVIVFDYMISVSEVNNQLYGVKEFLKTMKKQHSGEKLLFSIKEGKMESFLEYRNLEVVEKLDNEEIEKSLLLTENGSLLGHVTGHMRFVMASPKKMNPRRKNDFYHSHFLRSGRGSSGIPCRSSDAKDNK